jgi:polyribonucleotide nucleotidyltransferase
MDFGALVNFMGNRDGLVHISEIMDAKVDQVKDHLNEGDIVKVKLLSIDDRGKYKLSMRLVDQESGEELQDNRKVNNGNSEHHKPRGDRERDHNRERRDNHNRENREGKDRPAHHKQGVNKRSHDRGDRNRKPHHNNNGNNFNNEQFNREEQPQKKESALRKLFRF